jgi:hypothetical protein
MAVAGGGAGLLGVGIYIVIQLLSGGNIDPGVIIGQLQPSTTTQQGLTSQDFAGADQYETFASTVLGSTNDTWTNIFKKDGKTYQPPHLVLFRQATQSGCGVASSDVGPFYCPPDSTIYLDETFFDVLQKQYKAKGGDVAQAYVIAHEAGHNVQEQLGIMDQIDRTSNAASVKVELQADCFAGVWAHDANAEGVFQPGEVNEALDAAAAVGDDRIQKAAGQQVNPETWTHGSAAERQDWFNRGYKTGNPADCNTFGS